MSTNARPGPDCVVVCSVSTLRHISNRYRVFSGDLLLFYSSRQFDPARDIISVDRE